MQVTRNVLNTCGGMIVPVNLIGGFRPCCSTWDFGHLQLYYYGLPQGRATGIRWIDTQQGISTNMLDSEQLYLTS